MTTCPTCQLEFAGKLLQRFCSRPCQKAASNAVRATGNSTGRPSKSPRRQAEAASPIPTTQAMPARIPASYTGDDGKVWHCIQIAKVSPIQWSATYGDVVLGQWRDVERCAARALITAGLASREDWMLTLLAARPLRAAISDGLPIAPQPTLTGGVRIGRSGVRSNERPKNWP
jgi:hypothetical protein